MQRLRHKLAAVLLPVLALTASACAHSQSFVLSGQVRCLIVRSAGGQVNIKTDDSGHLHVSSKYTQQRQRKPEVSVELRHGVLLVENHCQEPSKRACEVDFDITLPPGVRQVEVNVERGDVDLEGLEGQLSINVQTGRINGRRLETAIASASTRKGDIELELIRDAVLIQADTEQGNIELVVPTQNYKVDAVADAGTIDVVRIHRAPNARRRIIARTDRGDVGVRGRVRR
jgi:hypothetical protein